MKKRIWMVLAFGLVGLVLVLASPGPAIAQGGGTTLDNQEQGGSEDLLSGFEDDSSEGSGEEDLESGFKEEEGEVLPGGSGESVAEERIWSFGGFIRWDSAYNYAHDAPAPGQTDYRGLSKFRLALRLEMEIKPGDAWEMFASGQAFQDYVYNMRDQEYPETVLDRHEKEGELREAYFRVTPTSSLDITLGRQIVAWGKSDSIQVVDIINPLDFREPGLTDISDMMLPVTLTKIDYYLGDWGFSAIAIHEVRFSKNPALGSDYNPVLGPPVLPIPVPPYMFPNPQYVEEEIPEDGGENTQYAVALNGFFTGWDLGFYWAQVFSEETHLEDIDSGPILNLRLVHSEITMTGLAVNVALGNWLLKSEAAQFKGYEFFNVPDRTFTRNDTMLGIEYSGLTDTTLSLEGVNRHWAGFDPKLELFPDSQAEDVNQYVFSYRGSFLREALDLVAVLAYYGKNAEQGSLQRYSATYELAEALDMTGGVVVYTPGEGENFLLVNAQDNDRVFLDLKWSF